MQSQKVAGSIPACVTFPNQPKVRFITSNSDQAVTCFKNKIKRVYEITNLADLCWFLGMEIKCDHAVCIISINQSYESLNGNLRLVLFDRGFKQLSDPNTTVVYRGNLLFLTMGIMYLPCEYPLLTALVW